jgi:tRNA U34 5-carboxymethylaminomethyl modifying enzyme MnmG/GidA
MSRVIDAWDAVFGIVIATEQEAHLIEHLLESEGWKRMSAWFDDIETNIHTEIVHKLIKQVNRLRGRVTPAYAFYPQCWGHMDIEQALASVLGHLKDIRGTAGANGAQATGLVAVCNAAESSDDYASEKLAWKMIKWLEDKIAKYENRLDKLRSLGLQMFLAEMMG